MNYVTIDIQAKKSTNWGLRTELVVLQLPTFYDACCKDGSVFYKRLKRVKRIILNDTRNENEI